MYKYDLHIHTSECDKVATMSGAEIVGSYVEAGYKGIVITDHYFSLILSGLRMNYQGRTREK